MTKKYKHRVHTDYGVAMTDKEYPAGYESRILRRLYDATGDRWLWWAETSTGGWVTEKDTSRYPHGGMGGGGAIIRIEADKDGNIISRRQVGRAPIIPCP